ncbi:hypothetical protein GTW43_31070, partial [Streptomyces sp. SID5785]|uniref:hypothetical protein n=1 Tax=Streptomyces sp. SID5785 TaxID=2690309 RepID=UPI001361E7A3
MRRGLLALRAVTVAAALVTVPVAAAHGAGDGGSVTVGPDSPAPGAEIELTVAGCAGTTGRAVSEAFVADAELAPAADGTGLAAEARVASTATPGEHGITVTCDGTEAKVKGTLRVLARGASPTPSPTAAVHAGGGGAAGRLA